MNQTPSPFSDSGALDYAGILRAIPHRPPFLFVDAVTVCERGKSILAVKNVSFADGFFTGHFPGEPVMPGVLQIEALAQACCILMALSFPEEAAGKRPAFAGIEAARFRKPVRPGDVLELRATLIHFRRGFASFAASAEVRGEKVCEASIKAALV